MTPNECVEYLEDSQDSLMQKTLGLNGDYKMTYLAGFTAAIETLRYKVMLEEKIEEEETRECKDCGVKVVKKMQQ